MLLPQHSYSLCKRKRMRREGTAVCVTGGSGFLASWLIKLLLHRGYTVKATVRDPNDLKKTDHLRALDGAGERLHLFKADLMEEGSFDAAVDGCEGVFHTASPISVSPKDPQAELIEPAVKGTLNVLRSCTKVPSVRRVVITSSMASMIMNGKPLTPDVLVDETWLSDPAFCKENKLWYMLSKTLAEDAAWKFAKDNGIDMVAVHPGWVFGPILQASTLNFTLEWTRNFIDGSQKPPHNLHGFVDVRDVAHAHIQAFEVPSASGRYCLVERVAYWSEILKIAHEHFPTLSLTETEEDKASAPRYEVSKEKAKTLGIEFTPVEATVIATVEGLKEKGFLTI